MPNDYIPSADADFDGWQQNFYSYVNAHLAELGLVAADLAPLTASQTAWQNAYSSHNAAQAAASGARQGKDTARDSFESLTRAFVRRVQAQPTLTDAARAQMSITIPRERAAATPPATRPVVSVNTDQRLRHTVNFVDETTPTSKAKPDGVTGCEIWIKIGDAPSGPSQVTYLGTDTRTPYVAEFDETDAGKNAHYMLRWINNKGETGPWSQTVSATITG
jgi:hypothetical protein